MIEHVWKCPSCTMELSLTNCCLIKSSDVAQGKGYSRTQPDFNLRSVKGIQLTSMNMTKIMEFMHGEMGIKIAHVNNLRGQITKVRNVRSENLGSGESFGSSAVGAEMVEMVLYI